MENEERSPHMMGWAFPSEQLLERIEFAREAILRSCAIMKGKMGSSRQANVWMARLENGPEQMGFANGPTPRPPAKLQRQGR